MVRTIAVIGGGLSGLCAAYHLRGKAQITLFEKEARMGGRVFTSQRPCGEHGAQFSLSRKSERMIHRLIKKLKLKKVKWSNWPGYFFEGGFAHGPTSLAAKRLLSPDSAQRVKRLLVQRHPRGNFHQWASEFLSKDRSAIAFVEMLLAGETCAPANHITAQHGLECLSSLKDDWYSIRGGTAKLVDALAQSVELSSATQIVCKARVTEVKRVHGGVLVGWREQEKRSQKFHAAVVATPDGANFAANQSRVISTRMSASFSSTRNALG